MSDSPAVAPAGWYPDAAVWGRERWWDGAAWTEHVRELGVGEPAPVLSAQPADREPPRRTARVALVVGIVLAALLVIAVPVAVVALGAMTLGVQRERAAELEAKTYAFDLAALVLEQLEAERPGEFLWVDCPSTAPSAFGERVECVAHHGGGMEFAVAVLIEQSGVDVLTEEMR